MDAVPVYERLQAVGLEYGAGHRAIEWVERGRGELWAQLSVPASVARDFDQYVLHPSVMDGALQACVGLLEGYAAGVALVPYALERVASGAGCTPRMGAWVRLQPSVGASIGKLDIDLCDEQGQVCVQLRGFTARPVSGEPAAVVTQPTMAPVQSAQPLESPQGVLLAIPEWRPSEPSSESASSPQSASSRQSVLSQQIGPSVQRVVLVCELPGVDLSRLERLLPGARCERIGSGASDLAERYLKQAQECFAQVQAILRDKPRGKVWVQVVAGSGVESQLAAGLSGLLRTAGQENPQLVGQVLLVEEDTSEEQLAQRLQRAGEGTVEAVVRYVEGARQVRRWREARWALAPVMFKERGVYLITGGLGGLGRLVAQEILRQTSQGQVVLAGRAALSEEKRAALAQLSSERVHYKQVDVEDRAQVQALIAQVCAEHGGLSGIVHSAGVIADNFIVKKSASEFEAVMGAKVRGTVNLDLASRGLELDFLVLFSSVAGALGNVGQSDYAAANGFMDGYAQYRNEWVRRGECHGRTVSINWPLWASGGMQMPAATLDWLQRETGMRPLETEHGLQALARSVELGAGQVLVLEGEKERLRE